jgi:glycine/D-amino acid oxidase-like deaminating enzyme
MGFSDHGGGAARRNGAISHWYRETGIPPARAPLPGDRTADVCIVGGGYTGLWTAYYLARARPDAEIVVLEREFAGFGASGRNGGWVSDHFAGVRNRMARASGRESVITMQRALQTTIDEILQVAADERIDADLVTERDRPHRAVGFRARRAVADLRRASRSLQPPLRPRSSGQARPRPRPGGERARSDDPRVHHRLGD